MSSATPSTTKKKWEMLQCQPRNLRHKMSRNFAVRRVRPLCDVTLAGSQVTGRQRALTPHVEGTCLAPRQQDDKWLRTNIFRSTCTIHDRIYRFIIDSGSCRNVISEEAVTKLGILREPHPAPYSLGWLYEGVNLRITQRALVSFSI